MKEEMTFKEEMWDTVKGIYKVAVIGIIIMLAYKYFQHKMGPSQAEIDQETIQMMIEAERQHNEAILEVAREGSRQMEESQARMVAEMQAAMPPEMRRQTQTRMHVPKIAKQAPKSIAASDYFTEEEYANMNCGVGNVRYEGNCYGELEFLKMMNSKETDIELRREAREKGLKMSEVTWRGKAQLEKEIAEHNAILEDYENGVIPEDEIADLACPFDNEVVYKGVCIEYEKVIKLQEADKME